MLDEWREAARHGWPGTDHSDCCEMPYCRSELDEVMRDLPAFAADRLRRLVDPLDREYAKRTLPYPLAPLDLAWWYRRCPDIDLRWPTRMQ
ncbi:hypothetical protein GCM10017786_53680 [Amycolatopsis deserti]|uniref:Uncharacterized protein n=1 Tax=Amycolatopsis deserti TaxID=185696 RepID=A0ABQ3JF13_9PSEU|nr:hypothetical protein GCM10017786_53680 [Amycolatopsis deserti]